MRRQYDYQCQTCGMEATIIWKSEVEPTDEEIPLVMPCRNLNCTGQLNRSRPIRLIGTVRTVGLGFLNHDGDLVMVIRPDQLTEAEKQVLNPANAVINIRIPGT